MTKFPQDHPLFLLPLLDGVHLRVFFVQKTLGQVLLPYIKNRKETYGSDVTLGLHEPTVLDGARKKLVVEFSSPNACDFQGKHLRSAIHGAFISKLYETMGWDVTRINYLGDWGKSMALLAVGWEKFGNEEAFEADPAGHLINVYHRIHELFLPEMAKAKKARDQANKKTREDGDEHGEEQAKIESEGLFAERNAFFKKLEEGDEEALALVKRFRDVNIANYTKLYSRLGIDFDEYSGESQISQKTMTEVEQLLKDKGVSEESEGAWIVGMKKHGARAGTAMIRYRTGASTYLLRDLAAVLERSRKFKFDKMIFVVANDQNVHFSQLIKILLALDMQDLAGKLEHVHFSNVSKTADRMGIGHQPLNVLDQCEEAMLNSLKAEEGKATLLGSSEDVAKVMGISALLTQELSARRSNDHAFDIDAMTSFKPETGPGLQYWYARLCSILKANPAREELSREEYESLAGEKPANLLRLLAQYPEVTHTTYKSMESAVITTYLVNLIEQLQECLGEEEEVEELRVTPVQATLYEATRIVFENAFRLLGIKPVAKVEQDRADTPVAE
ncbi:Nucleotidylyl transferase [Lojkania enalia]|uniref:arginine--tRNA ligase n=1 Tax=Lojkania enalia TaxID=147567 RepID=A0A9P4N8S7_9PLEO|nr:Nucleotidylyl transferase [Didymosphaeria enalia]